MFKKSVSFLTASFILIQSLFSATVFAKDRELTLDNVRKASVENSDGVESVKIDKIKKEIELKQAKDGISDIRKKESTIRFSLLMNIEFPEKHGMPKEIELLMKVPQIQNEIEILKKQQVYEELSAKTDGEQAFYDALLSQNEMNFLSERISDLKNVLKNLEKQIKTGTGKEDDKSYTENQISNYEKEYENAVLKFDENKKKLGSLINSDVRLGFSFKEELADLSLKRDMLSDIIEFSKNNDFELYKKIMARKLAEKEVETVLGIYKSQYSKYISDVETYIKTHEGKTIDYDDFIKRYNDTLYQIDSPWYGNYVINLLFFKIKIPKEWFKGEYSGTRYMEDQKYELFISLVERDKARKEEENEIKSLEEKINSAYSSLKSMEKNMKEIEENLNNAEIIYKKQLNENKLGIVDFTTLEQSRDSFYSQQKSLFEAKYEYAKALSTFDLTTSGYINKLLGAAEVSSSDLEAGVSNLSAATWYIKNNVTDFNFIFGVNVPEEYDVNYYQLFYNNVPVGERVKIDDTIIHTSLTYSDTEVLNIKFYKDNELKYTAQFEGSDFDGVLVLEKAEGIFEENSSDNKNAGFGTWSKASIDTLRDECFFNIFSEYDYDKYEILYKGNVLKTGEKGESFKALKLYFNPISELSLVLYKANEPVKTLYLIESTDGEKILSDIKY